MTNKSDIEDILFDSSIVYVTEKQFKNWFISEVKYWIRFFGLLDWEVRFNLDEDDIDNEAYLKADIEAKDVTFNLCKTWNKKDLTEEAIRKAAFHEVEELLQQPLSNLAEKREWNKDEYIKETHSLIKRYENTLFKERWNKIINRRKKN